MDGLHFSPVGQNISHNHFKSDLRRTFCRFCIFSVNNLEVTDGHLVRTKVCNFPNFSWFMGGRASLMHLLLFFPLREWEINSSFVNIIHASVFIISTILLEFKCSTLDRSFPLDDCSGTWMVCGDFSSASFLSFRRSLDSSSCMSTICFSTLSNLCSLDLWKSIE